MLAGRSGQRAAVTGPPGSARQVCVVRPMGPPSFRPFLAWFLSHRLSWLSFCLLAHCLLSFLVLFGCLLKNDNSDLQMLVFGPGLELEAVFFSLHSLPVCAHSSHGSEYLGAYGLQNFPHLPTALCLVCLLASAEPDRYRSPGYKTRPGTRHLPFPPQGCSVFAPSQERVTQPNPRL